MKTISMMLLFAALFLFAPVTKVAAQENSKLCVVDKSGQRNGLWNTCYSILRKSVGPDETIICSTGMLRGVGHCRVVPKVLCDFVEGAIRQGDAPCMARADREDPDFGVIGWRPVRSMAAQEPLLLMTDFILALSDTVGAEQTIRIAETATQGFSELDQSDGRASFHGLEPSLKVYYRASCSIPAELIATFEERNWDLSSVSPSDMESAEEVCQFAQMCIIQSLTLYPPIIDGLRDSYFLTNAWQCPLHDELSPLAPIHDQILQGSDYGAAAAEVTALSVAPDTLDSSQILQALFDIRSIVFPEEQAAEVVPLVFDKTLVERLDKASLPFSYAPFAIELRAFDLLAQKGGTTLKEIAAVLLEG